MTDASMATEIRQIFLAGVGWTVVGQLYILGAIAGFTFGLLRIRQWRKRRFDTFDAHYGEVIMNELLDNAAGDVPLVKKHRPRWYQWFRRASLRRILLNNIRSIAGHEKNLLVQTYCILGFANADRDRCYSMFWWRRLEGLSNLSGLELADSAVIFNELRKDREELVAMSATLALSGLRHPLNNARILHSLSVRALRRRNLLLQVANNWTHVYGGDFVFARLESETRDALIRVFIAALAEMNSPEVGAQLTRWVTTTTRKVEPQTLVDIIRTLRAIGDPSSISVAEKYLVHPEESVRCEAIGLIVHVGTEDEYLPAMRRLSNDTSVAVQRVLRHAQEKRVAA